MQRPRSHAGGELERGYFRPSAHLGSTWEGYLISLGFSFFISKFTREVLTSQNQSTMLASLLAHGRCSETCPTHMGIVTSPHQELVWKPVSFAPFPCTLLLIVNQSTPLPPPLAWATIFGILLVGIKDWDVSCKELAYGDLCLLGMAMVLAAVSWSLCTSVAVSLLLPLDSWASLLMPSLYHHVGVEVRVWEVLGLWNEQLEGNESHGNSWRNGIAIII